MCNTCCHIDNVIFKRNGTNQNDRFQASLNPDNVELHDFTIEDWLLFAFHFAQQVNYFSPTNAENHEGNWQSFFNVTNSTKKDIPNRTTKEYSKLKESVKEMLKEFDNNGELTPHLTLFVCFLKLLEYSKDRFNSLTQRHLSFFYKDILKIEKLPVREDQVHVVFELAKKALEEEIPENAQLDAKKDVNGGKLIYEVDNNFVVNKATVGSLKSTFNDIYNGEFKYSEITNSFDGLGKELPENSPFWFPFGYNSSEKNYDNLPDVELGFSIASPVLAMKEGTRNVCITIDFNDSINIEGITSTKLLEWIQVSYSTQKSWQEVKLSKTGIALHVKGTQGLRSTFMSSNQLQLVFSVDKDLPAIENYNNERLKNNLSTEFPVVRFLLKTNAKEGHDFFRRIVKKAIGKIKINVAAFEVKDIQMESDFGVLNPAKPFMPFTSQPIRGGAFHIKYPEVFTKKWSDIAISANWMNTPTNFVSHYNAYKKSFLSKISKTNYVDALLIEEEPLKEANQPTDGITDAINDTAKKLVVNESDLIINSDKDFKATSSLYYKEDWKTKDSGIILFQKNNGVFQLNTSFKNTESEIDETSQLKLTLNQSFLHSLYPMLYTLAFTSQNDQAPIPNQPYTPLIESIKMSYAAQEEVSLEVVEPASYETSRIQLHHNDVFGVYEEHSFLKEEARKSSIIGQDVSCYLVPDYCHGGELYIGLKDVEALQQVSLLIQVLEGSENPNVDTFVGKQGISWSVLCRNYWKKLEDEILVNEVDNFLKSGIVQIKIPEQATAKNTKFSEDYIWLRAKMHKSYDAVCKVFGVYAQATIATFSNNKNELSHLEKGLTAETISKLVTRIPQVKGVQQPFNSFGGKPEETDLKYYQRVSERLRHKNRAINLWDYEHLILEEFPEVFRVKCLNHTSKTSFMSPGNVLVIVIPDIINRNVFDIYEPRLSQTTLNEIEKYVNTLNGKQVEAFVDNAQYERVHVEVKVKFYPQFDENFYKDKLQEDITKLLSPWAFNESESIEFGIELNNSSVIDYVEKLPYVDYLVSLELAKISAEDDIKLAEGNTTVFESLTFEKKLSPSSPKHILVSSKTHSISTNVPTCNQINIQEAEQCLY
ncbi:Baseplate J-like protein [Tenacibaculum sp. MAR_2009_124]|uniref:baseplate J/gp47 family protein n=1 Tax=Tenacibaculum sp. MAR_2009_124 TaxID=1250059 RepID=UPI0008968216|nr:baseplate J/gp47 family protein [Tenacibaculum sp. MAR_2009_124]SEC21306.1 Baseplate J-like protein [Tenacibaculum sp. MAR_2009_124]